MVAETTSNWRVVSITHPSLSMAELGYLDGVTSNIQTQFSGKQATLVSGTNIKTINGTSVLGSGNVTLDTFTGLKEVAVSMAGVDINCSLGNYFYKTISGATVLTVSNAPTSGNAYVFVLELTNGGSSTVTWFSGVQWAGGIAPKLTASGVDRLVFVTRNGGTSWSGSVIGLNMRAVV